MSGRVEPSSDLNILGRSFSIVILRRVSGDSMYPAFPSGRLIVAVKRLKFGIGDVVLVHHKGLDKLKRIKKYENQMIFVEGDNSSKSTDSRDFGWLNDSVVVARVVWPRV